MDLRDTDSDQDEDSLEREADEADAEVDAPRAHSAAPEGLTPGKRPRGRPKGTPKTGGAKKPDVSDAEIARTLRVATPKIIERLTMIAQGRDVWHSGTTGKGVSKPATLKEQLRAAELVLAKVIGDKTTVESTSTNTNLVVEPSVEQAESIRRALLDDLMMKARTDASGEGGIEASRGENESPDVDARAESRFLTSSSDNVPSDPSIVSVTDPKQIAEFDRRIAAAPAAAPNERHFPNGWSWRKTWDHGMGHYHWDVFAPGGVHASIRRSEERATRLCEAEGDVTA